MGWSRRLLKTNAKKAVKQNYWRYVSVCFLVMLICGSSFTSTQLLQQNPIDDLTVLGNKVLTATARYHTWREVMVAGVRWFFQDETLLQTVILSTSLLLWILYKIFIANIVRVDAKRFYLETRTYQKTSVKKLGYLYRGKDIRNPAKIMLLMYVHLFFWWFTIIGGIIKTYEYSMIPYILAENPDILEKEAFALSKRMMHGKKFGLFVLQISFIGWFLLGLLTMGLTNIFYLNPYYAATEAEYYMMLRREIVGCRNRYSQFFVDKYLENKPSEDEILINMFVLEKDYMPSLESDEFSRNVYPMFLRGKDSKWYETPYTLIDDRRYHITTYIILFFLTAVIGWALDVSIGFMRQGKLFTGGLLVGPILPAVGIASVLILLIGRRLIKHPIVNVFFIALFTSSIQYGYVWLLERVRGVRFWDFSDYILNLNGRICLSSAVVMGALGTLLFYIIGPGVAQYLKRFPIRKKWKACMLCIALLILDIVLTVFVRIV